MGRESRFDLQPHSWYPTDRRAFEHLLPHLAPGTRFVEPRARIRALEVARAGLPEGGR